MSILDSARIWFTEADAGYVSASEVVIHNTGWISFVNEDPEDLHFGERIWTPTHTISPILEGMKPHER